MPDWQKLVRTRLSGLVLEPAERAGVIAELAAHLEQVFEEWREQGLAGEEAIRRTLLQVEDWQDLRRRIQTFRTKENTMNDRVKQLWLPGLLTFALSMGLQELVQKFGPKPLILSLDKGTPILMFYIGWLLMLPLAGALGAYLSKRAGGSVRMVLSSSLFPVLPFAVVFLIATPIGLMIGNSLAHHIVTVAFFTMALGWVLAPGAALFVGGLLVQLFLSRPLDSRRIANS